MVATPTGTKDAEADEASTAVARPSCRKVAKGTHRAGKHAQVVVDMGRMGLTDSLEDSQVVDLLERTEAPECGVGCLRASFTG